jgi:hypothetical protein
MGSKGTAEYRTRSERERQRREKAQRTSREAKPSDPGEAGRSGSKRRRAAATDCAWCGGPFTPRSRGPIPKWCSATCRHRAWEQRRAAASGRAAVRVVERRVEVAVPLIPTRHDWPQLLAELARQLDDGRVYDRDLVPLATALNAVLDAYRRRPFVRDRSRGSGFALLW